jgi:hypothetical protein
MFSGILLYTAGRGGGVSNSIFFYHVTFKTWKCGKAHKGNDINEINYRENVPGKSVLPHKGDNFGKSPVTFTFSSAATESSKISIYFDTLPMNYRWTFFD